MCTEKQNLFQITGICTDPGYGEPTCDVMTINYLAEQGRSVTGETGRQRRRKTSKVGED